MLHVLRGTTFGKQLIPPGSKPVLHAYHGTSAQLSVWATRNMSSTRSDYLAKANGFEQISDHIWSVGRPSQRKGTRADCVGLRHLTGMPLDVTSFGGPDLQRRKTLLTSNLSGAARKRFEVRSGTSTQPSLAARLRYQKPKLANYKSLINTDTW